MTNADIITKYERYLTCRDCSKGTIEHYLRNVKQFLAYIRKKPEDTTQKDLDDYKIHLKTDYNPNSIVPKIAAINWLMTFLNKPLKITAPSKIVPNKNPLTEEEIQKIFLASKDNPMDYAILHILYYGQLRREEVTNLNLEDIDWDRGKIRVNKGKGNRYDTINIHPNALNATKDYLPYRGKPKNGHEKALFINRYRTRISKNQIHFTVKRAGSNAGITKRIYPHLFRISSITHMSEHGATMPEIQKQSRHQSLDTLQGYIQLSEKHAKDSYLKTIPSFTQQTQHHERNHEYNDDTKKLLLQKLLHNEISEEVFKLALQTLDCHKPDTKKTLETGYHY